MITRNDAIQIAAAMRRCREELERRSVTAGPPAHRAYEHAIGHLDALAREIWAMAADTSTTAAPPADGCRECHLHRLAADQARSDLERVKELIRGVCDASDAGNL